ncbi:hypothetical protein ACWFZ6_24320 [Methylorubrum extorquens]
MEPTLIKPPQATLGLPRERLLQLQALAKKRETTIVSLIEGTIADAIANGEISDELEGFSAEREDFGRIRITIRGVPLPLVGSKMANAIAIVLDAAAGKPLERQGPTIHGFEMQADKLVPIKLNEELDHPATIAFMRHGKAVMFSFRDDVTGEVTKTSFPPSIALDLARMIRREIGISH